MSTRRQTALGLLEATQRWSADDASKALEILDEITALIWELHGQRITRQYYEDAQCQAQDANQQMLDLGDDDLSTF